MNHQRLKCYNLLIVFAKRVPELIRKLPRGNGYIEDQLRRAMSSAILNLSEGNGRRSKKERNRFFDISLGSIAEVAAILDLLSAFPIDFLGVFANRLDRLHCSAFAAFDRLFAECLVVISESVGEQISFLFLCS